MKKLKVGTLFSGIGSFEHALGRMNIEHELIFASDIDKFAKESFFENYDMSEDRWYDDVRKMDATKIKQKIDILVGGSPCQSFSLVGKRKGLDDDRGNLVFEYIRILNETKPKYFIFENVKGLLSQNSGKTWELIKKEFEKTGYKFKYKVLNARDFGIPQNRERVVVMGFKFKKDYEKFSFPEPIKLKITMQDLLEDNVNSKYFLGEKGINFVTKEKNIKKRYTQINGDVCLCQKANQQFNWHGDFVLEEPKKDVDKKYYLSEKTKKYVLSTGTKGFYSNPKTDLKIARPILQSMHKMHRAGVDNYITKGSKIRKLTPRETHRLMGFSDNYKIIVSDTQAYRQSGNSIVTPVLMAILDKLLK